MGAPARERRGRLDRGALGLPPGPGLPVVPGVGTRPRREPGGPAAGTARAWTRPRGGRGAGQRRAVGGGPVHGDGRGAAVTHPRRDGRPVWWLGPGAACADGAGP